MRGKLVMASVGLGGALVLAALGSPILAGGHRAPRAVLTAQQGGIVGTWLDTVTPTKGPVLPFLSTLVFTASGAVIEATSKSNVAPTAYVSEGLGVWKGEERTFKMTFQKYLFNSSGVWIGRTVIVETDTLQGDNAYTGQAVTTIYNTADVVMISFPSTTAALRMHV